MYPILALSLGCIAFTVAYLRPAVFGRPWISSILAAGVLALPYFILGPASLIAGTDELQLGLPGYLLAAATDGGYAQGPTGGVETKLAIGNGLSAWLSLDRLFFAVLPIWVAIAVHKIAGYVLGYWGGYLLAASVSKDGRVRAVAGLWGLLIPFNDVVIGWGFAGMALVAYVVAARPVTRGYWVATVAVVAGWCLSHSPYQLVTGIILSWGAVALLVDLPFRPLRLAGGAVVMGLAVVLNWAELSWALVNLGNSFGRQFDKALPSVLTNFLWALGKLRMMPVYAAGASLLLLVWAPRRHWRVAVVLPLFLAVGPLLQSCDFAAFGLGVLNGFNFNYVVFAFHPLLLITIAHLGDEVARRRRSALGLAAMAGLAVQAIALDWVPDLVSMVGSGGLRGALQAVQVHDMLSQTHSPERTITLPVGLAPAMTAAAGIDTLDGYVITASGRLRAFWEMGIKGRANMHGALHGYLGLDKFRAYDGPEPPLDLGETADLSLLRVANVGYVLSRVTLAGPDLVEVSEAPRETPWTELSRPDRIARRLRNLVDPSPLHLYRLSGAWPRLFIADAVHVSTHSYDQREFYDDVRDAARRRAVVIEPGNVVPGECCGNGDLSEVHLLKDGAEATTEVRDRAAMVVLNATWSPFFSATVDGRPATTLAVNGFQTGLIVPTGRHRIAIRYHRPTLAEKLETVR